MRNDNEYIITGSDGSKLISLSLGELSSLLMCEYQHGVMEARKELFSFTDTEIKDQKRKYKSGKAGILEGSDLVFEDREEEIAPKPDNCITPYYDKTSGEALKELREEAGLSPKDLYSSLFIDKSTLSRIESNKVNQQSYFRYAHLYIEAINRLKPELNISIYHYYEKLGNFPKKHPEDSLKKFIEWLKNYESAHNEGTEPEADE